MTVEEIIARFNGQEDEFEFGRWQFSSTKLAKEAFKLLEKYFPGKFWKAADLVGEKASDSDATSGGQTLPLPED